MHRILTFSVLLTCFVHPAMSDEAIEFNRDVRGILSDKCFQCHGPDAGKRQADLRLDVREAAIASSAIAPANPDGSELIRRIESTDPDVRMPPPTAKLGELSKEERKTLRRWIEQDAKYEPHWSFIPLKPQGATVSLTELIDTHVVAGLANRNLELLPEADRNTLIRRLSFDLTGLPPTPAQVAEFVADKSTDAYERLIDRLLDSKQYGERMAVDWLDAARYADSYGFQVDREREMWPWRDWVIEAFNRNLPFDEFITWQLAGDLLPNPSDEQILATAFNRLHQQEAEGGSVEEEYRVEYVCDRVQTFATTFLGLTFECCRCHDHKFDPFSQREYYQLFSMFQNIDEAGLYSFFTTSPPTPVLVLADAPAKQRLALLEAKVAESWKQENALRESRRDAFKQWLSDANKALPPATIQGTLATFRFDSLEKNKLENLIQADQPATLKGENKLVEGHSGNAIQFTGDDPVDLPLGNFKRQQPFSIGLWLRTPDLKDRAVVFHRSRAWTDAASRGYELLIEDGRLKWSLIHFWPGNAISIAVQEPLPIDQWVHVVVSSDGSSRAAGLRIFIDGQPAATQIIKDRLTKEITGGGGDTIALGERFRDRGFKGGCIDDFSVFDRELTSLEVRWLHDREIQQDAEKRKPETVPDDQLFEYFLATVDSDWKQHLAAKQAAHDELNQLADSLKEIMVMRELPEPKKAFVLARGEYAQRLDEVQAGTPVALSPFPEGAPRNRLGLAKWLTDRQHPLTARVAVNRVWQSLFGRGLVKTSEDFGSQGSRPLYPQVLDQLAVHFIENGWDMKRLVKTIVMSRTYRQRSVSEAKIMADDPDNDWLARGPRFRLPAEMIRDNALATSGLLRPQLGGPPVNPYEMSEAFKPTAASAGDGVYRRSLYTNWRRTGPPPAMVAFDAPRRAVCIAKRERTDSPLQALILLNGVQYVEAARVLGTSLHQDTAGDLSKMIEQGFLRCLSRSPDAREVQIMTQLYREQLEYFQKNPEDAARLLKIGNTPSNKSMSAPEAAAATVLAQTLFNHDSSVVKR